MKRVFVFVLGILVGLGGGYLWLKFQQEPTNYSEEDHYGVIESLDSGKILSLVPSNDEALKTGESFELIAEVKYTLDSEEGGQLRLWIQAPCANKDCIMFIGSVLGVVKKGSGTVSLKKKIKVPHNARIVELLLFMQPKGTAERAMGYLLDRRIYRIADQGSSGRPK